MRAVLQRVTRAKVTVDGTITGEIGPGVVALIGVGSGDSEESARQLAGKIAELRIFEDEAGKMNRSLLETGGAVLAISQFTLYGDCRKGRRPSFDAAARPELARALYEKLIESLRERGLRVEQGVFQAMMQVELVNDGPVTLLLDTCRAF
jgi:D-tyrosyl-tRNA(Tyr) deacylase